MHRSKFYDSNVLSVLQEKELALAAGKLEECQKTIASLNQQLKSLTTLDDLMFEAVQPEHNIGLANLSGTEADDLYHIDSSEVIDSFTISNGRERSSPQSSPRSLLSPSSSNLSEFMRTLSCSRSTTL